MKFSADLLAAVRKSLVIGIRAGSKHRVIGVWAVVVDGRVFVRSWSLTPGGWYEAFAKERHGIVEIAGKQLPVRAVRTRSEKLKAAVDKAYAEKYHTPASAKYVKDLRSAKSRATTTELVPV